MYMYNKRSSDMRYMFESESLRVCLKVCICIYVHSKRSSDVCYAFGSESRIECHAFESESLTE